MLEILILLLFVLLFAWVPPFCLNKLANNPKTLRVVKFIIFGTYIYANLCETILFREVQSIRTAEPVPLWSYREALRVIGGFTITDQPLLYQIILNIILYIPMGYLLPFVWEKLQSPKWVSWSVVCIGMLCSILTELTQFIFHIGLFELDDIMNNTLGCFIGYVIYSLIQKYGREP